MKATFAAIRHVRNMRLSFAAERQQQTAAAFWVF